MTWLIDEPTQQAVKGRVDRAVAQVLRHLENHNGEDAVTSALGEMLLDPRTSLHTDDVTVKFSYRKFEAQSEESPTGADGGFIVSVTTSAASVRKAALFQSKLLRSYNAPRSLSIPRRDADRLRRQAEHMTGVTREAVGLFYTRGEMYVVDAHHYAEGRVDAVRPLNAPARLITLGTYLGKWLPRCTRGDGRPEVVEGVSSKSGLRHLIELAVATHR